MPRVAHESRGLHFLMLADVVHPDTVGGAGRVVRHVAEALTAAGHRVSVVSRNPGNQLPSHERLGPRWRIWRFSAQGPAMPLAEMIGSRRCVRECLRRSAVDVVVVHQSMAALGPIGWGGIDGLPMVYVFHSPWHDEFQIRHDGPGRIRSLGVTAVSRLLKRIEAGVVDRADTIMVLSDYTRRLLIRTHGVAPDRIQVIPGGVDPDRFQAHNGNAADTRQALGLPVEKTCFITVRNLVPRMGLDRLIQAVAESRRLREQSVTVIVGDGPSRDKLIALARSLGCGDAVRFWGRASEQELPKLYAAADFFVLPTRELEGFGLVILEALACGTPVLGTPVGAIPEVLGGLDSRLVMGGADTASIRNHLELALTDDPLRIPATVCRQHVLDHYQWQRVAQDLVAVTHRLLTENEGT